MKFRSSIFLVLLVSTGCSDFRNGVKGFGEGVLHVLPGTNSDKEFTVEEHDEISFEEEYWIGRAVAAQILSIYKPLQDEGVNRYVATVGQAVAKFSDRPDTFKGYSFQVIQSDEVNALSAPGGFVFITTGLLKILKNEDDLAAILAHEISHIQKRHGIAAIKQEHRSKGMSVSDKVLSAIDCSQMSALLAGAFEGAVNDVFNTLVNKGYSRDQEFEADQIASEILHRSGYRLTGLFETLSALSGIASSGGWFSTHPSPSERIEHLGSQLKEEEQNLNREKRFKKNLLRG